MERFTTVKFLIYRSSSEINLLPKSSILDSCGTVILPHAIINNGVVINRGCILNIGAIVDHGCILEEGVHICLGAIVKGENRIEKCNKIEAGEVAERGTRK